MCDEPEHEFSWRRPKDEPQEIIPVSYRDKDSTCLALSIGYDPNGTPYVLWRGRSHPESIIDKVVSDEKGLLYVREYQCDDDARCADNKFLSEILG